MSKRFAVSFRCVVRWKMRFEVMMHEPHFVMRRPTFTPQSWTSTTLLVSTPTPRCLIICSDISSERWRTAGKLHEMNTILMGSRLELGSWITDMSIEGTYISSAYHSDESDLTCVN